MSGPGLLPDSIGMMKHLRFLDVSCTGIKELPESITKLYNLQDLWMTECKLLKKVPKRLKNLVNLTSIFFDYENQMPSGVSCLTNLQRLSSFVIGPDRGGNIEELECLNELSCKLVIVNLELVKDEEEAKKANMRRKTKLDYLALVWSGERDYDEQDSNYNAQKVLEGLQPCKNLKELAIHKYLGKQFPSWLLKMRVIGYDGDSRTLDNLTVLRLEGCRRCEEIPGVGHLPLLRKIEIIKLDNVRYIGDEFYCSDGAGTSGEGILFPALKTLQISSMESLVEWKAPTLNAFPCLEELTVSRCPKLKSIPTSHLSSLVEFAVECCDAFEELSFDEAHPLTSLRILKIKFCSTLVSIQSVQGLTSLVDLLIASCKKLTSLPRGLKSCSSLNELSIFKCDQLASVPEDLRELLSLVYLHVVGCPNVTNLTGDILRGLTQLKGLGISCYYEAALNSIHQIPSLTSLVIAGRNDFKSLPYELQNLTLITELTIFEFEGIESLPEWLGTLSSLELICIDKCSNLKYLPSAEAIQGLSHLEELLIEECPLLKERCAKGTASEWSKISHIPKITIDKVIVQDLGTLI